MEKMGKDVVVAELEALPQLFTRCEEDHENVLRYGTSKHEFEQLECDVQ